MTREVIEKVLEEKKKQAEEQKPPLKSKPEISEHVSGSLQEDHQPEQANQRGGLENSIYENSEENPIDLNSPFGSPIASMSPSRVIIGGDQEDPEDPDE